MKKKITYFSLSLKRCRKWILVIFIIYNISCFTGILLVHKGNSFSLSYADKIVGNAVKNDQASVNYLSGNKFKAALIDFSSNVYGSVIQTFMGLSIVVPYFSVAYQGWVGGIVSVDNNHQSRLKTFKSAAYYFIVLILQYIPYSLVIGSGLKLGVDTYRLNKKNKLLHFKIDKPAARDVLNMYIMAIPLFFLASCFEFLSSWNS